MACWVHLYDLQAASMPVAPRSSLPEEEIHSLWQTLWLMLGVVAGVTLGQGIPLIEVR